MTAIDMQSSGVTPDDALAATVLAPVDWDALVCEFGRREAHYARDLAIRHGIGVEKIDALTSSPLDDRTARELERALHHVWNDTSRPDTAALQAYYVYARCLAAWERTLDHDSVGQLIGVVAKVWSGVGAMWDTISSPIGLLIRHTESLIDCMATERALNCSCPDDFVDKAARVVDSATGLRRELAGAPTDAFATLVAHVLDVHGTYYRALVEVGNSVRSMLENPTETDRLDRAIAALQQVHNRPPLEHDVYDSELGAHLHLLTRMRCRTGKMCGSPPGGARTRSESGEVHVCVSVRAPRFRSSKLDGRDCARAVGEFGRECGAIDRWPGPGVRGADGSHRYLVAAG